MKFNNRIQAFALGLAVVASSGLSIAFAQSTPAPSDNAKQEHAWGQHKGGKHGGRHMGCDAMKKLNLTEDQKARLKAAGKAFHEQNAAEFANIKAKRDQLRQLGKDSANDAQRQQLRSELKADMQALHTKRKAAMQGILTPEQESQLQALKQECKAKHMAKRAERKQSGQSNK